MLFSIEEDLVILVAYWHTAELWSPQPSTEDMTDPSIGISTQLLTIALNMIAIYMYTLQYKLTSGIIHYLHADGLETRAPPYYKVHISVSAIIVTGKKYRER